MHLARTSQDSATCIHWSPKTHCQYRQTTDCRLRGRAAANPSNNISFNENIMVHTYTKEACPYTVPMPFRHTIFKVNSTWFSNRLLQGRQKGDRDEREGEENDETNRTVSKGWVLSRYKSDQEPLMGARVTQDTCWKFKCLHLMPNIPTGNALGWNLEVYIFNKAPKTRLCRHCTSLCHMRCCGLSKPWGVAGREDSSGQWDFFSKGRTQKSCSKSDSDTERREGNAGVGGWGSNYLWWFAQ